MKRRVISVVLVGTAALAAASTVVDGPHVVAIPPVIDVHVPLNTGNMKVFTLKNDGTATASIQSFVQDVALCDSGVVGSGAPATIAPGATQTAAIMCAAETTFTIDRCHFFARDPAAATLGSFTGLCIVEGGANLTPLGGTTITFPDTAVGAMSAPQSAMLVNAGSTPMTKLSIQIADQDGNFEVGAPCLGSGPGCKDQPVNIMPTQTFAVSFTCTPKSPGSHSADVWIVGDNGTRLTTPYTLVCNGNGTSGGATITSDKSMVALSARVIGPSQSSTVHITNAASSTADLHITSISAMGTPEWTAAAAPPCNTGTCTLPPGGSTDVTVTFTPQLPLGPGHNAALAIASDDPLTPMLMIPLNGTALGGTLAMATNLGMPPTLPIVAPVNQPGSGSFLITNNGNDTLGSVMTILNPAGTILMVTQAPASIAPNAMPMVVVSCTPTSTTTVHAMLTISSPEAVDATSPLPAIDVSCTGTTGSLVATPNPLQLGEVRTNDGMTTKTITLTSSTSVMLNDPVLLDNVAGMSLGPLASPTTPSQFDVLFMPTVDGPISNTATVTASDTSSVPIGISGQVTTADLDVPETIQAGAFCVNGATSPTPVALTSTGTASIFLMQPTLAGGTASPFQLDDTVPTMYPYHLPKQETAMIAITPRRQDHPGMVIDTVRWVTDMPGKTGPATMVTANFVEDGGAIAPQTVDFGSLPLLQPATDQIVTLRNCGSDSMDLSPAVIAPPNGDFRDASTMPLPMTLAPNQTATVTVGFKPKRAGLSTGTLTIASSKGELGVTLSGRGIGLDQGPRTSFYACACQSRSSDPSGVVPIVIVAIGLVRRRRR